MSESAKKRIKTAPIILKKNKIMSISNEYLLKYVQNRQINREDILYVAAKNDDLFKEFPYLTITNKMNILTNTSRTVATYTENSSKIELNSDKITELVGQNNYDLLLNAISSIFNQNVKIKAILALLKRKNQGEIVSVPEQSILRMDKTCQTEDTYIEKFKQDSRRKKRKQRCRAYVVDDKNTLEDDIQQNQPIKRKLPKASDNTVATESLIDTKFFIDEDSIISDISIGNISLKSSQIPHIVDNPQPILDTIQKHSQNFSETQLKFADGSVVMLKVKPKDLFHLATLENLRGLSVEDRKKLMFHQAYIDWRYCLQLDSSGNLPLHAAVLDNDVDFLRRQCLVLISRQESLDVLGGGGMSALQLSVHQSSPQCTSTLLDLGARVSQTDTECRTVLHTAAENSPACVHTILEHCSNNARKILMEDEDLTTDVDRMCDGEMAAYLLNKLCSMYDNEGYTPLMLASARGAAAAVRELVVAAPQTLDIRSPTSGDTALYLAVSAVVAARARNLSQIPPDYLNTIKILSQNGADHNIANDSGTSVTTLLCEFKNNEITQILANKVLNLVEEKAFDSFMLVKGKIGDIKIEPVGFTKQPKMVINNESKLTETNEKRRLVIKKETERNKNLNSFEMPPKDNIQEDTVVPSPNYHTHIIKTENMECPKEKVIIVQNIHAADNSLKIDRKVSKRKNINTKNNIPVNLKSQPLTSKVDTNGINVFIVDNISEQKKSLLTKNYNITKINTDGSFERIQDKNLLKFHHLNEKNEPNIVVNKMATAAVASGSDQVNKLANINKPSASTTPITVFSKAGNKSGVTGTSNSTKVFNCCNKKGIKKFIVKITDRRKNDATAMVKRTELNSNSSPVGERASRDADDDEVNKN